MEQLELLHRTLSAAAALLDSAATQVRDAKLSESRAHIMRIGEALTLVFELQHAVEATEPRFARTYEKSTEEQKQANRRLGNASIVADEIAESCTPKDAEAYLRQYATEEPSSHHANLAVLQAERYKHRHDG